MHEAVIGELHGLQLHAFCGRMPKAWLCAGKNLRGERLGAFQFGGLVTRAAYGDQKEDPPAFHDRELVSHPQIRPDGSIADPGDLADALISLGVQFRHELLGAIVGPVLRIARQQRNPGFSR